MESSPFVPWTLDAADRVCAPPRGAGAGALQPCRPVAVRDLVLPSRPWVAGSAAWREAAHLVQCRCRVASF